MPGVCQNLPFDSLANFLNSGYPLPFFPFFSSYPATETPTAVSILKYFLHFFRLQPFSFSTIRTVLSVIQYYLGFTWILLMSKIILPYFVEATSSVWWFLPVGFLFLSVREWIAVNLSFCIVRLFCRDSSRLLISLVSVSPRQKLNVVFILEVYKAIFGMPNFIAQLLNNGGLYRFFHAKWCHVAA